MVRNTTHHSWPFPDHGDQDYEFTFDDFVDTLDVDVVLKDTKANRPAAGTAGRWFLATDELHIYYDDGSTWNQVTGSTSEYQAADGTATDPKFTFSNDTDTGLYRPGGGRLAVTTNGTKAAEFDSTQDLILPNGDINMGAGSVRNVNDILNSTGVLSLGTDASGTGIVQFLDRNASSRVLHYKEGGNDVIVEDPATGLFIEPTSSGLSDGGTINSQPFTLRGYYDSDTSTTVTASSVDAYFQHVPSSDGSSRIQARVQGTLAAEFHSNGVFEFGANLVDNTGNVVYDYSNDHVPSSRVQSSGLDADTRDSLDHYQEIQRTPNHTIPMASIPDADYVSIPVYIPANTTLEVFAWGCRTDTQGTPSGLTVELYDETGGASVLSQNTARNTGNPITSLSAGSTASDATLRLNNSTGGSVNAGAVFGYRVA